MMFSEDFSSFSIFGSDVVKNKLASANKNKYHHVGFKT